MVAMTDDLFSRAYARNTDPSPSHMAAKKVKTDKLLVLARDTLRDHGERNMEEVSNIADIHIDSMTPRFAPLVRMRWAYKVKNPDGTMKTSKGASGSERQVYAYQPDQSLWLAEDPAKKLKLPQRCYECPHHPINKDPWND